MKSVFTAIITIIVLASPASVANASGGLSPWAEKAVALINQERQTRGLPPLTVDAKLERAADVKLSNMDRKDYFAHTSPDGLTPWSFIEGAGYRYRFAGENLAIHFKNPENEHDAWMQSEKHCENILDPRFQEIGISVKNVFFEGRETMLTVSMFGTKSGATVESAATKDTALALCRGELAAVSGAVDEKDGSDSGKGTSINGDVPAAIGAVASVWNRLGTNSYRTIQILAVIMFSIAQVSAVYVVSVIFLARERREGVFLS